MLKTLDKLDAHAIHTYFKLPKSIEQIRLDMVAVRKQFYQRSFVGCSLAFDPDGNRHASFNMENDTIQLVAAHEWQKYRIAINEFRNDHFRRYLATLKWDEVHFLEAKYIHNSTKANRPDIEQPLLDEITEIEAAVCFRFGLSEPGKPPIHIEVNSIEDNMHALLGQFWG
jgi:hypothetical protein